MKRLEYYEICDDITSAIQREKLIKKWRGEIKLEAIERMNPEWKDLYDEITQSQEPDPVTSTG